MTDKSLPFETVIIIGAGRSGTNALRDALTRLPGFETWPCDEINPIWRHGNLSWPNDEIPPERATPAVRRYIRNAFARIWRQTGRPQFVVEKTCANSLRVDFVNEVLPDARYIEIVRDGVDVVASARKRWKGEMEFPSLPYYWAKVRFVPLTDLPWFGFSFLRSRFRMLTGKSDHLSSWGPRFSGMLDSKDKPLEEHVAAQWAACVLNSRKDLAGIPADRVIRIRYEDFVQNPLDVMTRITEHLGAGTAQDDLQQAVRDIHPASVGKGKKASDGLSADCLAILEDATEQLKT